MELQLISDEATSPQVISAELTIPVAGTTESPAMPTNVFSFDDSTGSQVCVGGYGAQMYRSTDAAPIVGSLAIGAVRAVIRSFADSRANSAVRVMFIHGSGRCIGAPLSGNFHPSGEELQARRVYFYLDGGRTARKPTWHEIAHQIFPGSRNLEGEEKAAYRRVIARLFKPA